MLTNNISISTSSAVTAVKIARRGRSLIEAFLLLSEQPATDLLGAVIVCSINSQDVFGTRAWTDPPGVWFRLRQYLYQLRQCGAIVVLSAGNEARRSRQVDTFPALFGEVPSLGVIVVGATTLRGFAASFSQQLDNQRTFWAPGQEVACIGPNGVVNFRSGTSLAAPLVSSHHIVVWFSALTFPGWRSDSLLPWV